ncbi:MAG: hypothetical protein ACLFV7_07765, partial [Phycisphaerae bacterium]
MAKLSRQPKKTTAQKPAGVADPNADFTDLWRPDNPSQAALRGPERVLLERGVVSEAQLNEAANLLKSNPHLSMISALVQSDAVEEATALEATAAFFDLPFMRVNSSEVDPNVFALLPKEFVLEKNVLPICRDETGIVLGVSDPADIFLIENVGRRLKKPLRLVVV